MSDDLFSVFRSNVRNLDDLTQRNLYYALHQLVYSNLFFLLNDHTLVEDAINEVFIKAMHHGPKTREDSNIKAWLKQVARNTAFDMLRKNKKYRQVLDIESVIDNEDSTLLTISTVEPIEKIVEDMSRSASLIACLEQLKWEYRIVLYLKYIEEMPSKEIAHLLGIKEPLMSKRLKRAKAKLAELFLNEWGDES
ncbi:RNA polymerase sigma-70 factor (ECF subfamily) [Paenibacillus anaericanus]|uniref:RNA polymerase sigma factor n=1 Tax=Paenibacillus TaxID=44249 RepID=UPI00147687E4|nr:sigma-70 family RNA polymerase sigma factor [Paenibacillus anaericanus]MDQ0090739.1 RNA polymerase sigma-70 factor (ECF subfamily) [Paenibacillus anaericanus]